MAANQSPDGRWDAEDFGAGQVSLDENGVDREFAGKEADTGLTALVMLSFLGAGYTHEEGRYAVEVDRALDWLISQQGADGNLCGNAEKFARMYCHAMATYSLAEAYGMQKEVVLGPIVDPEALRFAMDNGELAAAHLSSAATSQNILSVIAMNGVVRSLQAHQFAYSIRRVDDLRLRAALAKAVAFTISQQDPKGGGWRYKQWQEGDVSMLGWQLMSLKSAEIAGVNIPETVRTRMKSFVETTRQGKSGGLFGYRRNVVSSGRNSEPVSPTMTAEALFCQQMLGYPRDSASSTESIAYLMRNPPRLSDMNFYYWYYGTLAMYQHGGKPWQDWNSSVRDMLVELQVQSGPMSGTWDPKDEWGRYGGRLYSTALATLSLEVYYRLLPLYRMNETTDPKP
ncbi:MAG: prenyltransferase/squalene oxidase repeat-containing protein [Planctomycetaceae bacterium]